MQVLTCAVMGVYCVKASLRVLWDAAFVLACSPVDIGNRNYTPMQCALNKCLNCADKWKDIVAELELNCSEQISYVVFGTHSKYSYHGDIDIRLEGKECMCVEHVSICQKKS